MTISPINWIILLPINCIITYMKKKMKFMNKTFVLFLVYIARRRKKITIIFSALIITITSMTIWFIFRCCKDLYHIEVDLLYFGKYKLSISDLNELKS